MDNIDQLTGFIEEIDGIIHYQYDGQNFQFKGDKETFTHSMISFIESRENPQPKKLPQVRTEIFDSIQEK